MIDRTPFWPTSFVYSACFVVPPLPLLSLTAEGLVYSLKLISGTSISRS